MENQTIVNLCWQGECDPIHCLALTADQLRLLKWLYDEDLLHVDFSEQTLSPITV